MANNNSLAYRLLGWLVTLVTPFAIILTAVRILLTPAWVNIEYRMPGFPEDTFGFTFEDRIKWSLVSLDYLLNNAGIEFFDDQRFSDDVPIYNERELQHLLDVKEVVKSTLLVWYLSLGFLALVGIFSNWGKFSAIYKNALLRGVWLTFGLVGVVVVLVVLAFGVFFVYFHEVLFDPGTWTFSYADTLIRLFPQRFWQDAFLWIGGFSILISLWLYSLVRSK